MPKREDGKETRWRLLNAACDEFAQKGYREAKVAEICKKAGANVAAVNYYFGNKKNLYSEAWHHAVEGLDELISSEPTTTFPQDRLRNYIQTLIQNFVTGGKVERFSRLYLMELANPTGLIKDSWHDIVEPKRRKLHAIIRDILGPNAEELKIRFCELSILNQCRAFITMKRSDFEYMLGETVTPELIRQLTNHISDFSLAGIREIACKVDVERNKAYD